MDERLHFYYPWEKLEERALRGVVREFLDNGADQFVISDGLLKLMVRDTEKREMLRRVCRELKVSFSAVHGLDGNDFDLNVPVAERRPGLFADHLRALEIAVEFGCRTYTVHVGAGFYCYQHVPLEVLRPLAVETLEKLLPAAEKLGIIIAVENSFEKPNSAREVLGLLDHFPGHPALGVCYDSGHAHCMENFPGRNPELYQPYFANCWWENGVENEDDALGKLHDHVVVCHLHDNDGYGDLHSMPLDGTIDWRRLVPQLLSCPRLADIQSEVCFDEGENWAGKLPAPPGGYSIRRLTDTFRYLGF